MKGPGFPAIFEKLLLKKHIFTFAQPTITRQSRDTNESIPGPGTRRLSTWSLVSALPLETVRYSRHSETSNQGKWRFSSCCVWTCHHRVYAGDGRQVGVCRSLLVIYNSNPPSFEPQAPLRFATNSCKSAYDPRSQGGSCSG